MQEFLEKLQIYNTITIQCHNNPDADSIASGFALYKYFSSLGKDVSLIYGGNNPISKSNLKLMIDELKIPLRYIGGNDEAFLRFDGLLITVDCQYGAGNVEKFIAEKTAVIDHHQEESEIADYINISSSLGSCSTLVWQLLKKVGYEVTDDDGVGTALYYGLYTDTNQLSEISTPLDRDAADQIPHRKSLISLFRNSNISLKELEIAGVAMLRYSFNEEYKFAVIRSQYCDPNILGLIADFLLQVDVIRTCVVFNESGDGNYKLSIRSCVREVNASELSMYLTHGIGSGGGHYEKAGGSINKNLYHEKYPSLHGDAYINNKMVEYFDSFDIIYAKEYNIDTSDMKMYRKKNLPVGVVRLSEVFPVGTPFTIRTLEGDMDLVVEEDLLVIIGIKGEVYPNREAKFNKAYNMLEEPYVFEECVLENAYTPTIKNRLNDQSIVLTKYAKKCAASGDVKIQARQLDRGVKVFAQWDQEKYMLGKPGDFLAVRTDDMHDIYVIEHRIFEKTYDEV